MNDPLQPANDSPSAPDRERDQHVARLLAEIAGLDSDRDAEAIMARYAEAAALVDRADKPLKWAALRHLFGAVAYAKGIRLDEALAAFRESRPCWDPVAQRTQWAECTSYIGFTLDRLGRSTPPDSEEIIACLEATLPDYPDETPNLLAKYYQFRTVGDAHDNWQHEVRYLGMALDRTSATAQPVVWAALRNVLANAISREPAGDYAQAMETRIGYHEEALAALTPEVLTRFPPAHALWIAISVDLSDAFLGRVLGPSRAQDLVKAALHARAALAACDAHTLADQRAFAHLAVVKCLLHGAKSTTAAQCQEALSHCDAVDALFAPAAVSFTLAHNLKFRALVYQQLIQLGEPERLEPLLAAVAAAAVQCDPLRHAAFLRVLAQIAATTLLDLGQFARAVSYFSQAETAGEANLAQATSRAARLEAIFDLHDASALRGYCLVESGELAAGIEALDRNKGRLWQPDAPPARFDAIRTLVPPGGALLFPCLGPQAGWVVVVTAQDLQRCALPELGRETLHAWLAHELTNPDSTSWLACFAGRMARGQRWSDCIDAMGERLFHTVWAPLLPLLAAMGVSAGAELVWFPQAGLAALPVHAAWRADGERREWIAERYALRQASSARALLASQGARAAADFVLVENPVTPNADLRFAALETALVTSGTTGGGLRLVAGHAATVEQVLAVLESAGSAHFACHGQFDVADPFKSGLVLTGGERLTLDRLLPRIRSGGLRRVVLSACDSGVAPSWRFTDELIGFPAAFLEHGVQTVVASLWPVDDLATALLLGRFYQLWQATPQPSAAQALRAAQAWLRGADDAALRGLLRPLKDVPGPLGSLVNELLLEFRSTRRRYAHPEYWAGFVVSGL